MLPSALFMPFFALLYFRYVKETGGDPIQFYKWSAFGYTLWFILPVVLGTLCTMLMYEENQHDMLKQLWIVPISKMEYFFSKFFVVLIYSICFMLITAIASVVFSVLPGYVTFEWGSVLYLLKKCLEIGIITSFVMLPILAIAASQKGYILPVTITLVYVFLGFILMTVNMYLHPLPSMAVIVMRNGDIPGLVFTQAINIPLAFLCICVWNIVAVLLANIALGRRK
jgi:bacitracin transport system permease protein